MKKIALYILAAAAILAGCSKKNIDTTPVNSEDAWMYDATLPVPVKFTAGGNKQAKSGVINTVDDMVGKEFGFFAVNTELTDKWPKSYEPIALLGGMPQNVSATAVKKAGEDAVTFNMVGGPYFYSQTDHTPFAFYGYHARVDYQRNADGDIVYDASGNSKRMYHLLDDQIKVETALGYVDILHAKAKAEEIDGYKGFNARYIRKNPTKQPFMNFEHKTAYVSFRAKASKSMSESEYNDSEIVTIESAEVLDTYTKADLIIAHLTNESLEGTLANPTRGTLQVLNADDESALDVELLYDEVTSEGVKSYVPKPVTLGEPLFILPDDKIAVKITYKVESRNSTNGNVPQLDPVIYTLDEPVTNLEGGGTANGYIAGYMYNYTLVVHSPEKVVIEADITPYKSAFGAGVWEDVEPDYNK